MRARFRPATSLSRHAVAAAALLLLGSAQATNYTWSTGYYAGPATLLVGDTLDVLVGGTKYLNSALANQGAINAFDNIYFANGNVLSSSGTFDFMGDVGFYDGGYNGGFNNSGLFRKGVGAGTSWVSIAGFVNSGLIDAQTGTIRFNAGATFNAGSQFDGAGQVVVSNGASFNGNFLALGTLRLTAGVFNGGAAQLSGTASWEGGRLDGTWEVAANQTLQVGVGGTKYVNGTVTNLGTVAANDNLYFINGQTLHNASLYDFQGDHGIYDGGYNGNINNTGTLRKSAGIGSSYVSIAGFSNSGVIEAQSGTIIFNAGAVFNHGTQFTGAGAVVVSNGASFNGTFTTAGNLTLAAGVYTGTAATMGGNVAWSGGRLDGSWINASGSTLAINSGGTKYVNGTVTNQGTLAASDHLYFVNGQTLHNESLYDFQGDYGIYDGGYNGNIDNAGTLRKSAGVGTSYVSIAGFSNTGVIEAQTGTINFNAGAAINGGSHFAGGGQVVFSNGAHFSGAFTSNGHLVLASGVFTGHPATMDGDAHWTGGRLDGTWDVAAGRTLSIAGGTTKYVNGTVNNHGLMAASDSIFFLNGQTMTNIGRYELQGDVGMHDGGYNGNFINQGTLAKTAGAGVSTVAGIGFANNGVVDVQSGTIRLPNNFSNAGTLMGVGAFASNAITNAGHVAPGASPGTLTISANFTQTAAGSLDVELANLASSDLLLVNGNAALGGTLALSCWGMCSYAVGDMITVLDATGSLSGTFAGMSLSGFATGAFDTIYDIANARVMLQVTEAVTAVIPEPGNWALMLGGLAALGWLGRRRSS
jgi:hypothetical protein